MRNELLAGLQSVARLMMWGRFAYGFNQLHTDYALLRRWQPLRFCSIPEWKRTSSHSSCYDNHGTERERESKASKPERLREKAATVSLKLSCALHVCCFSTPNRLVTLRETSLLLRVVCERGAKFVVMLVETLDKAGAAAAGEWCLWSATIF